MCTHSQHPASMHGNQRQACAHSLCSVQQRPSSLNHVTQGCGPCSSMSALWASIPLPSMACGCCCWRCLWAMGRPNLALLSCVYHMNLAPSEEERACYLPRVWARYWGSLLTHTCTVSIFAVGVSPNRSRWVRESRQQCRIKGGAVLVGRRTGRDTARARRGSLGEPLPRAHAGLPVQSSPVQSSPVQSSPVMPGRGWAALAGSTSAECAAGPASSRALLARFGN